MPPKKKAVTPNRTIPSKHHHRHHGGTDTTRQPFFAASSSPPNPVLQHTGSVEPLGCATTRPTLSTSANDRQQQRQSLSDIRAERVERMRRTNDAAKTRCDQAASNNRTLQEERASSAAFTRKCYRIKIGSTKW
ncbi:unnamed protein product [Ectocarpus fasciculatus]